MRRPTERHQKILQQLAREGFVRVAELSARLKVSEVTIRKDLQVLEGHQLLFRTHGGASASNPYVWDQPIDEKAALHAEEKQSIGRAAAALVAPRETVILASGTTVNAVARQLAGRRELTVITSALPVALELSRSPEVEVLMLGGMVRRSSQSVVGPYAERTLHDHVCGLLFLGVDGFDLEHGLTTTNEMEAELNRAMMRSAQRTIVVTDSSKFGRRGYRRICGIEEISRVVTDAGLPDGFARRLEEAGVDVTIAGD